MSQTDLSRLAGVSQPVIAELEAGNQRTTRKIAAIARALQCTVADLEPDFDKVEGFAQPRVYLGTRDLPVYAAVEGGPGEIVVSTTPIEFVPRPWYLGEVKEGYAVLIVGDSMDPAFRPGEIAIVNPRLPPMRNKDHILIAEHEDGTFRATIKHVTGWSDKEWRLLQYNPPRGQKREFTLPRQTWGKALRVVGKYEGG